MTTRDSMADCATGAGARDLGRGDYTPMNFAFMTLEEEATAAQGTQVGWTRINMPCGEGPMPDPAPMVGMRGEGDLDNDMSYGPHPGAGPSVPDSGTGAQGSKPYGSGGAGR